MATDYTTNKESELTEALLNMIRVASRNHTLIEGVIDTVDEDAYTCEVTVGDSSSSVTFSDIPLETVTGSPASFILIPNIGSNCLLLFRDGNQDRPQLFKIDSVSKVWINPTVLVQFNQGKNGGIVLVNPLVTKLNDLENDRNNLKDAIVAWEPVSGDGGAALKIALAAWLGVEIVPTEAADIQSTVITQ